MITALKNAIYVTGKTVTGLSATNFNHLESKRNTPCPKCVFQDISTPSSFDSGSEYETTTVQFSLFNKTLSVIETISTAIMAKFDFGKDNLSVSGYDVITCIRRFGPRTMPMSGGGRQIVLQYIIKIQKSRS